MMELIDKIKGDFRTEIAQSSKEQKQLHKLNAELYQKYTAPKMFEEELTPAQNKKLEKERKTLEGKIEKLVAKIDEIKSNKIYENAFEWRFEFPEVLDENGDFIGFDVVIGNPPYVFGGNEGISKPAKEFFKNKFETGIGKINLFTLFIELGSTLMKEIGEFAFIIPNTFLRVTSYSRSRKFLIEKLQLNSIYDFGDNVFDDAVTTAVVITATKRQESNYQVRIITEDRISQLAKSHIIQNKYVIALNHSPETIAITSKMRSNSRDLGSLCKEMIFGVVITKNKAEVVSSEPKPGWKPFLEGKEIGAYRIDGIKQYLNYDPSLLHRARSKEVFEVPEKIVIQRITGGKKPLKAAYDNQGIYNKESINNIILNEESIV
jgi:tRNA1(Val) A37 N6-methylase TrmN6